RGEEVLRLSRPEGVDLRVLRGALHAAVPAPVVVGAVAVALAVGLVVLGVGGDEIVPGEAIVTRDEVDARSGLPLLVGVEGRAAHQPVGEPLDGAFLAAEEAPNVVAEPAVPLLPAVSDESAHLVEAGRVPRLGDQL